MAKSISCFGGANGERGFVSYFDELTACAGRLYIIKGGCGCGKSALMKKVAERAEKCGYAVERIRCASDPAGLDGLLIPEKSVGLLDGTAPHEVSPRMPGAVDVLVDLGEYLREDALREQRGEIVRLSEEKSASQSRAYRLLAAVGCLEEERTALLLPAVLWDKMRRAAMRLVAKEMRTSPEFSLAVRPQSAFCSEGLVYAAPYGEETSVPVKDPHGIEHLFYGELFAAALETDTAVTVSPDPLFPDRLNGVMFDGTGVLFRKGGDGKALNLERFTDAKRIAAVRGKLRFIEKAIKSLKNAAMQAMAESRACHMALEAIYTPAMDFDRVDARTERIMKDIFG